MYDRSRSVIFELACGSLMHNMKIQTQKAV